MNIRNYPLQNVTLHYSQFQGLDQRTKSQTELHILINFNDPKELLADIALNFMKE